MVKNYCMPCCPNSSTKIPSKMFLSVPKGEIRKKWITAARPKDQVSLAKVSDRNSFRANQNYSDSFRYLYPRQCSD